MNVENLSPLRYPGGKSKLYNSVRKFIEKNNLSKYTYTEPFAGGSGLALNLLFNNDVKKIHLNDFDRSIYALWYAVLNETEELIRRIINIPITIEVREQMVEIQKNKESATLIDLGFSTLFLNRVNRSGIIKAGVIGGMNQDGNYKLDCRFKKVDLIRRISMIAHKKNCITLTSIDALELMKHVDVSEMNFFYLDPPYFNKGPELYMNYYSKDDHVKLGEFLKSSSLKYLVSYDDCEAIRIIYGSTRHRTYTLIHNVSNKGVGKEIMYFSKGLRIPENMFYKFKDT